MKLIYTISKNISAIKELERMETEKTTKVNISRKLNDFSVVTFYIVAYEPIDIENLHYTNP